jgi:hypothetical protein
MDMWHFILSLLNWFKLLEWPGRMVNLRKSWHEMKVASAARRVVEFEMDVAQMARKIRKLLDAKRKGYPHRNIALDIRPAPGDDPEVFNEAMRRIRYASTRMA